MAPRKRPLEDDSVWVLNKHHFQQLYQTERKTLKDVKRIMETELSTYETKLRELGLRKRLKRDNWLIVAQHYLNRSGKDTGVYLNGTRIPSAWREIRRSGGLVRPRGQLEPLPPGVAVRTPTPSPKIASLFLAPTEPLHPSTTFTSDVDLLTPSPQMTLPHTLLRSRSHHNAPGLMNLCDIGTIETGTALTPLQSGLPDLSPTMQYADEVYRNILKLTPSYQVLETLRSTSFDSEHPFSPLAREKAHSHALQPFLQFQFSRTGYNDSALDSHFDVYHFLGYALYLLSNNLLHRRPGDPRQGEIFEVLFKRIPGSVLSALLESRTPTVRAAWEELVTQSWNVNDKNAFTILMHVGLRCPDWISLDGHSYLIAAAAFDCLEIVRLLLRAGCRPDQPLNYERGWQNFPETAIMAAIGARNLDCVALLLRSCDVNRKPLHKRGSCFAIFVASLCHDEGIDKLSLEDHFVSQVLDMFLALGASVDLPIHTTSVLGAEYNGLDWYNYVHESWQPTIVEGSYYWNPDLFKRLEPYSAMSLSSEVTRFGCCLAARHGAASLRKYLKERPGGSTRSTNEFLQSVLVEQFLFHDSHIATDIVQSLVNVVEDMRLPFGPIGDMSYLLFRAILGSADVTSTNDLSALFSLLIQEGAVVHSETLIASVTSRGVGLLEKLADLGVDFASQGADALCAAARLNNFEAVSWLLHRGVDINAGVSAYAFPKDTTVIAATLEHGSFLESEASYWNDWRSRHKDPKPSLEMFDHLIEMGVKLRHKTTDQNPFPFLKHALGLSSQRPLIELFLNSGINLHESSAVDPTLLEVCLADSFLLDKPAARLELFELLFERGAHVRPGSPLALLIYRGGTKELIRKVLDAGAPIDTYSSGRTSYTPLQAAASRGDQELVALLLSKGADINQPARGRQGKTALQAACGWDVISVAETKVKFNLVKFLIEHGANVNAPPSDGDYGQTALQAAAVLGDLEIVILLLKNQARVNTLSGIGWNGFTQTALDYAAEFGRIDTVKFLLSVGALSACPGTSGYQKAILIAEVNRYGAIAELIRKHAADDIKLFGKNPYLDTRTYEEKHVCTSSCFIEFERFLGFERGEGDDQVESENDITGDGYVEGDAEDDDLLNDIVLQHDGDREDGEDDGDNVDGNDETD
ncbi:hypothetical protein Z517_09583 [Fonsecaea pedrosoi CBS 271.37]|uniref:Clr5 domain-containing protein n=1 Tax=Fonsecaea pedrosoi CBS 271.37 TaxID=1442368 RepID=A0A0D2ESC0_9EURO|nr:uncharacterized protein Z517_09583 [Fonsecaea pedrosoi CBS 271.37]KIW77137.1 hypothetical protein Z517_09583 [Fonsecaea pedrosoi CBS 271.37]